jgi:capsular exopolysaccharide synthesis family protein
MEEEFDFRESWKMLRHNAVLAIIVFVIILGAVIAYTVTSPKIYEARSLIMVTRQDQTSLLMGTQLNTVDMETQKSIVLSNSVLGQVYQKYAGNYFLITAQAMKNSNVIEIVVDAKEPGIAMNVANEVASSYIDFSRNTKKQDATEVNDFITEQLVSYKKELDALNIQMGQFKNVSNLTTSEKNIYQTLQREIAAKSKLYDYLLSRREETSIAAQEKIGNVKIIQYAYAPYAPVKPNVPLNIVLGFVLALIISVGIVMFKTQLKTTVRSKEVEAEFGPSVICTIPRMKKSEFKKLGEEKGIFAESILGLRTSLSFQMGDKENKVIAVSSPQDEDGKSLIAANLALSFAHSGKKILLVDANFRNPSLGPIFGTRADEPGLTDAMLNTTKIADYIKKTNHRNLFFLPPGEMHNSAIEMSSSDSMKSVFSKLRGSTFDAVIVDTASLEHAESTIIGSISDGVLLVVAHDRTEKAKIVKASMMLKKAKAAIIGVVINFMR